jgi:hypothetical protein
MACSGQGLALRALRRPGALPSIGGGPPGGAARRSARHGARRASSRAPLRCTAPRACARRWATRPHCAHAPTPSATAPPAARRAPAAPHAAKAVAPVVVAALVDPGQAFAAATVLVLPVYAAMMAAPGAKLVRAARGGAVRAGGAGVGASRGPRGVGGASGRPRQRRRRQPRRARAPGPDAPHPYCSAPPQTRQVLESPVLPLLLGVPYALLLWQAWQAGALGAIVDAVRAAAPLPDVAALAAVFKAPTLTAMAWLHLLLLDLLQARWGE